MAKLAGLRGRTLGWCCFAVRPLSGAGNREHMRGQCDLGCRLERRTIRSLLQIGQHPNAPDLNGGMEVGLFTQDALYRGTDVTELWTVQEFRAYAEPYFSQGHGWLYVPRERHIAIAPTDCACVAWFDEILDSESYGTSRGTGIVVRGEDGVWRIAYYALTFPIPNALARDMTARIRAAQ